MMSGSAPRGPMEFAPALTSDCSVSINQPRKVLGSSHAYGASGKRMVHHCAGHGLGQCGWASWRGCRRRTSGRRHRCPSTGPPRTGQLAATRPMRARRPYGSRAPRRPIKKAQQGSACGGASRRGPSVILHWHFLEL
jgi:hypothetical protein